MVGCSEASTHPTLASQLYRTSQASMRKVNLPSPIARQNGFAIAAEEALDLHSV